MIFPSYIDLIFDIFEKNKFQIYLVGGFVRDFLMGKESYDFDMTTNATPSEMKILLKKFKILDYGEKYGTIAVLIDNNIIEITTFRKESGYEDNRHPNVEFSNDLKEDLSRRDFTINSICMNRNGDIIDIFRGKEDIDNKIIRSIGDYDLKFEEDALRILRGVRFASQLGFEIEENTYNSMKRFANLLDNISGERKYEEFVKCILGNNIKDTFVKYNDVFGKICEDIPKMAGFLQNNPYHIYDILEHTSVVIENTPKEEKTRIASFFHDAGKVHTYTFKNGCGHFYGHGRVSVEIAKRDLKTLKAGKDITNDVLELIKYHDYTVYPEKEDVKRWLRKLGENQLVRLFDLQIADTLAKSQKANYKLDMISKSKKIMEEVLYNEEAYELKHLKINGTDLESIGIFGKSIGKTLEIVLEGVIKEEIENKKENILEFVKKNLNANFQNTRKEIANK